jgi:nucleotide-binding universal stress UspA family protein
MFDRVVVGVTDSASSAHAVEAAMELTKASGGTLHMVSALAVHRPGPPSMPEEFRYSIGSVDPADWLLSQLAAQASAAAIRVITHSVLADPVEALARIAADEDADLIVVGAETSHGVHRAKVPDLLMSRADCAVLVV